jgi:sigma-E factor negative regulatory protein RseA
MKERISELLDGELESREAAGPLDALRSEGEARDTWRNYHLIGDAMRDTRILTPGFASRVASRLAQETTVMAPARRAATPQRQRWQFLSAAASLAAVAMVGWVAFAPQQGGTEVAQGVPAQQVPAVAAPVAPQVAPPATADDYLYAHQGQSPRNSLQGVAPYVRTVSGKAVAPKR